MDLPTSRAGNRENHKHYKRHENKESNDSHKTRGALNNPSPRFDKTTVELDDGVTGASLVTECRPVEARSIIARNTSPDIPFTQSINPYQGCEHGCIYCFARPTHAYLDLSPGLDFETRLTYKSNAARQLQRELTRPGYRCDPITLGANTDPYQPVERELGITRGILQVMRHCKHPVTITTKGSLVLRDIDLLSDLARDDLCSVAVSVTTTDAHLKRLMEPRAASYLARIATIEKLSNAGIPVTLLFAPVIPALNDCDMETIVEQAASAGARSAAYILLRLPLETRDLFYDWLAEHFPQRAEHVRSLLQQSRGGKDYDNRFGHRMRGTGVFADVLSARFQLACRKHGLASRETRALCTDKFDPAPLLTSADASESGQQDLFATCFGQDV